MSINRLSKLLITHTCSNAHCWLFFFFFFPSKKQKLTADIQTTFDWSLSQHYCTFQWFLLEEVTVVENGVSNAINRWSIFYELIKQSHSLSSSWCNHLWNCCYHWVLVMGQVVMAVTLYSRMWISSSQRQPRDQFSLCSSQITSSNHRALTQGGPVHCVSDNEDKKRRGRDAERVKGHSQGCTNRSASLVHLLHLNCWQH